jgi:hypothetical protein
VAGRIRSIEKSSDLIGDQTRDLSACSIVDSLELYSYSYRLYIHIYSGVCSPVSVTDDNSESV